MDGTLKFSSLQACVRGVIGNAESVNWESDKIIVGKERNANHFPTVDVVVSGEDYLSIGADTGINFRDFKMMLREGNDVIWVFAKKKKIFANMARTFVSFQPRWVTITFYKTLRNAPDSTEAVMIRYPNG